MGDTRAGSIAKFSEITAWRLLKLPENRQVEKKEGQL